MTSVDPTSPQPEPLPKRILNWMTPEECHILFTLAFGIKPSAAEIETFVDPGRITIRWRYLSIHLNHDGSIMAEDKPSLSRGTSVYFNAKKVVDQLEAWGIRFGD
ncbi:hypothetical protein GCM10028805_57470 [Spirosoma harenae]